MKNCPNQFEQPPPPPPPPRYWGCAQKNECYYAEVFPNCESSKLITFSWDQPCCPLRCLTFPQDFRFFVGEQASLSQILKSKVSDENWLKKMVLIISNHYIFVSLTKSCPVINSVNKDDTVRVLLLHQLHGLGHNFHGAVLLIPIAHLKIKHCQRHNGLEGWVHIANYYTNLDQTIS